MDPKDVTEQINKGYMEKFNSCNSKAFTSMMR
jgi:hypothetical protein